MKLKTIFWIIIAAMCGVFIYGLLNYWVFLNAIEDTLPESQEEVPELDVLFD